jgi:hypothetical protein
MKKRLLSLAVVMGAALAAMGQLTMDVNTKKLGAPIQSTMYGIFSRTSTMPLMVACMANW